MIKQYQFLVTVSVDTDHEYAVDQDNIQDQLEMALNEGGAFGVTDSTVLLMPEVIDGFPIPITMSVRDGVHRSVVA